MGFVEIMQREAGVEPRAVAVCLTWPYKGLWGAQIERSFVVKSKWLTQASESKHLNQVDFSEFVDSHSKGFYH